MIVHSPQELAALVKSARRQQKLSQGQAGKYVGLAQSTFSAFENTPEVTKLETLFRIFAAVGLEINVTPKGGEKGDSGASRKWDEQW